MLLWLQDIWDSALGAISSIIKNVFIPVVILVTHIPTLTATLSYQVHLWVVGTGSSEMDVVDEDNLAHTSSASSLWLAGMLGRPYFRPPRGPSPTFKANFSWHMAVPASTTSFLRILCRIASLCILCGQVAYAPKLCTLPPDSQAPSQGSHCRRVVYPSQLFHLIWRSNITMIVVYKLLLLGRSFGY